MTLIVFHLLFIKYLLSFHPTYILCNTINNYFVNFPEKKSQRLMARNFGNRDEKVNNGKRKMVMIIEINRNIKTIIKTFVEIKVRSKQIKDRQK